MKLKKIYIEVTNACNLSCSFCIKNKREINYMTLENYKYIINKIKDHTKEIYLHILGEPLMHKNINEFIDYAYGKGLKVNITTNGYLIYKIKDNKNINRLNISLHSYDSRYNVNMEEYLDNIFTVIDNIRDKTFVSLRMWVKGKYNDEVIKYINNRYGTNLENIPDNNKIKITNNLIIDTFHEFIWPDMNNNYYSEKGSCKGLIDHLGILSDGTIVPCCLDTIGVINLGSIYDTNMEDIYNNKLVQNMIAGFRKNMKCHELCKHCRFLEVKDENIRLERED